MSILPPSRTASENEPFVLEDLFMPQRRLGTEDVVEPSAAPLRKDVVAAV